jgi:hypothetical protein
MTKALIVMALLLSSCGQDKIAHTVKYLTLANGVRCARWAHTDCGYALWECTDGYWYACIQKKELSDG